MKYLTQSYLNLSELRKHYYLLALTFHPDKGGDEEIMKQVNNEFEILTNQLINGNPIFSAERKQWETYVSDSIKDKINDIMSNFAITSLSIEIIGGWIWVTGNTYPAKSDLKENGFKFSRNKTAWYWHDSEYKKRSKKSFDLNEIRGMFGTEEIKTGKKTLVN